MRRIVSLWLPLFPVEQLMRARQKAGEPLLPPEAPFALVTAGAKGMRLAAMIVLNDFQVPEVEGAQQQKRFVGRAVIHDNDLQLAGIILPANAAKGFGNIFGLVIGGD